MQCNKNWQKYNIKKKEKEKNERVIDKSEKIIT